MLKWLCNDSLSLLRYHFSNCVAVLSIYFTKS